MLLSEQGGAPGRIDELARAASRSFLHDRLDAAAALPCDLPDDARSLSAWIGHGSQQAGRQYRQYLDNRRAGAPRRYFGSKSHALHFLRAVAPTKLVDGAWLYGLLGHWADPRFAALIPIYLEELGDGAADKNHVALFRKLLAANGCEHWSDLPDEYFTQGAIQLSLGHHAAEFLPEVIGFNLGYEQLPLHLLITAYELAELGIDPYYFTLHVTVDNASTGHGRRAVEGVLDASPRAGEARAFYRRVANGYKLNSLGIGTLEAIDAFDIDRELLAVLAAKAAVGSSLHSDYCRIGGRTVNDWLSSPAELPGFLAALESGGWIKRGEDPRNSRFWRLVQDERAPMFGVFNAYEQQLLHDWIAGEPGGSATGEGATDKPRPAAGRFRVQPRAAGAGAESSGAARTVLRPGATLHEIVRFHFDSLDGAGVDDFTEELHRLRENLLAASGKHEAMQLLIGLMSPANHHFPAGLMATRIYASLFAGQR